MAFLKAAETIKASIEAGEINSFMIIARGNRYTFQEMQTSAKDLINMHFNLAETIIESKNRERKNVE